MSSHNAKPASGGRTTRRPARRLQDSIAARGRSLQYGSRRDVVL